MSLRMLINRVVNRRHWDIPAGTTHVLTFAPSWLIEPRPDDPAEGSWALESLGSFLAGASDVTDGMAGPAGLAEGTLYAFTWDEVPGEVELSRFELEIGDVDGNRTETVPAYWVVQAA